MPRILTSSNKVGAVSDKLRLFEGGTDATTGAAALVKLNAVPYSSINQASGVAGLDAQGKVNLAMLDISTGLGAVTVEGPSTVYTVGDTFVITNYDSFKNYTLTATNGTVTRVGDTITFIPTTTSGQGSFTIGGKTVGFLIVVGGIDKPTLVIPTNNAAGVTLGDYTMMATNFDTTGVVDTIESSDWQLSTSATFTTLVKSVANKLTDRNTWAISGLAASTKYYVRMRYKGDLYGYSEWSTATTFTTRAAYPAYGTLSGTSCTGTTKVLTYNNGTGGFYTTTVTDSTDCGYVAPVVHPAYGTALTYYCTGVDRWCNYADGVGGTYPALYTANSPVCGYVAPTYPAHGTFISFACTGTTKVSTFHNGTGGTYTTSATNSTDCGYVVTPVYPANGTLVGTSCTGTTKVSTFNNGTGGTYTTSAVNSTDCGYVAPPASGTFISSTCSGTTKVYTYHNGTGGTYNTSETNSVACGYVPPPAYGTVLGYYCSGVNRWATYADGAGGTYTTVYEYNVTACGYVAPPVYPAAGTVISTYCDGYTPMVNLANGSGGTYPAQGKPAYAAYFSASSCAPAAGTLLSSYCFNNPNGNGDPFWSATQGNYADGVGGYYVQAIRLWNYPDCTDNPPAGTVISEYCGSGLNKRMYRVHADGSGGTYTVAQGFVEGVCGYTNNPN